MPAILDVNALSCVVFSYADFHNTLLIDVLNCICMNGTLHIMHAVVNNGFVINDKTRDG